MRRPGAGRLSPPPRTTSLIHKEGPNLMTQRRLLLSLVAVLVLASASCSKKTEDGGDLPTVPTTPTNPTRQQAIIGCYAANISISELGCGPVATLGSQAEDSIFWSEVQVQSTFWVNTPATVTIFNECSSSQKN